MQENTAPQENINNTTDLHSKTYNKNIFTHYYIKLQQSTGYTAILHSNIRGVVTCLDKSTLHTLSVISSSLPRFISNVFFVSV